MVKVFEKKNKKGPLHPYVRYNAWSLHNLPRVILLNLRGFRVSEFS
jgi:hypothetical protein